MALYACPECKNDISEKAASCPHCGARWAGICPECQHFRAPAAEKCEQCGFPFSSATKIRDRTRRIGSADDGLGRRWFLVWTYVCYPISIVTFLLLATATGKPYWWFLSALLISIAIGLHERRLWAFQLNFLVILANFGALFLPAVRNTTPTETWFFELVAGAVFVVANAFYWQKRAAWFSGQFKIW
jgi:hypothetical protein